jgi:hypothetical protein
MRGKYGMDTPHYSCLNDILAVLVHVLQNLSGLCLHLRLDRLIEVDAYFLGLEVLRSSQFRATAPNPNNIRTGVEVILLRLVVKQDLSLHKHCKDLGEGVLW